MRMGIVFPGQGSQFVGMGKEIYQLQATQLALLYEQANQALGFDLQKLIFEGPESELTLTQNAQPAILLDSIVKYTLIKEKIEPVVAAGHSLGEFSALVAAGVLDLTAALQLVHKRGIYMQEAVPVGQGSMVAVLKLDLEVVEKICNETGAEIANFNSPGQIVISGAREAVSAANQQVSEVGGRGIVLDVSAPFHSSLMQPAQDRLAADIDAVEFNAPQFPVISTVSGVPENDPERVRELLKSQITAQVRWPDYVAQMKHMGLEKLLEVGPGDVLTKLNKRIERELTSVSFESEYAL